MTTHHDEQKIRGFIQPGSEIAGNVAGAAIGLLLAGPAGAVAGAATTPIVTNMIRRVCVAIYDASCGERAKVRAGATAAHAIVQIQQRLDHGERIRDDGFFDADSTRSDADEILEGVVQRSRSEHEERKTRFYANIFANAAFDPQLTAASINHVLRVSERLTYRQLGLLECFSNSERYQLRSWHYATLKDMAGETVAVLAEVFDLLQQRLLISRVAGSEDTYLVHDPTEINPSTMQPTGFGKQLRGLLSLDTFDAEDLKAFANQLR